MSALSEYFTVRYVDRLNEFKNKIQDLCVKSNENNIADDQYVEEFHKIYDQFTNTTQMHIKNFESQDIPTVDSDIKYMKFCSKDWLISFLSNGAKTSDILTA